MNYPQKLAPTDPLGNPESSRAVSRNKAVGELTDSNLDRKIKQLNQTVEGAFADHETAHETIQTAHATIRRSKRSAVENAWALGQHLVEKKNRLKHGEFLPWLATTGIADSSANEFMMLARQITGAGDLGPSIRATIKSLGSPDAPQPQPAAAPPPVVPAAPEPAEVDPATIISGLEAELADSEERSAIAIEGASPESRATIDKLNNQTELIRTLKASVANWQSKHADAAREIKALKRRNKVLEAAAAKVVPTGT